MIRVGAPVTVVVRPTADRLCVAYARVESFYECALRAAFYFTGGVLQIADNISAPFDTPMSGRFLNEEGVSWIRGHQTGEAIVALLAAASLDEGATPVEPIENDYSSAGWRHDFDGYLDDDHPVHRGAPR